MIITSCQNVEFDPVFAATIRDLEVMQPACVELTQDRIGDQMVDIPAPPVMEDVVAIVQEAVRLVPQERVQQRMDEQLVEFPVRQGTKEIAAVVISE